jgi:hypothetical protein
MIAADRSLPPARTRRACVDSDAQARRRRLNMQRGNWFPDLPAKTVEAMAVKLSRVRFTVRWAMAFLAVVAIVGALVLQQYRSARREAEFKNQLVIAKALAGGHERMRGFLGDMGIVIARGATRAEVLRVTGRFQLVPPGSPITGVTGYFPVAPDGSVLDAAVTRRLVGELLDPQNYIYVGADDLPDPEFGVRLRRGMESLDVLFSLSSGHLDVWAFQRDERGDVVKWVVLCMCL